MNIVHISTSDIGGAAVAASRIHVSLLKNNINSKFLTLFQNHTGLPAHYIYAAESRKQNGFIQSVFDRLAEKKHYRLIREILSGRSNKHEIFTIPFSPYILANLPLIQEADIIHLHWATNFINFQTFFKRVNKPIVWTLHDMNPFTGGCHYAESCVNYKLNCENCPQLAGTKDISLAGQYFNIKQESYSKINKLSIVAPSNWLKKLSEESRLLSPFRHYHIVYPVDSNKFYIFNQNWARNLLQLPNNKCVLLFLADNIDNLRKGFQILMNSLNNLPEAVKQKIHLLIVGSQNGSVVLPGISHTFTGYIKDEWMINMAYNASDAFVIPSQEDNLPNTIIESLATGTPVIGFNRGGIPELIVDGFNGLLVQPAEAAPLTLALENFVQGQQLFSREKIRENILDKCNESKIAEEYGAIYHNMMAK